MQEARQHLLDSVIGLTCVDPTIHPSVTAAPLVVSIITRQCLYLCHVASASQALLNEGDSSFWKIMRRVAEARERYTAASAPPQTPIIPSKRKKSNITTNINSSNTSQPRVSVSSKSNININNSSIGKNSTHRATPPLSVPPSVSSVAVISGASVLVPAPPPSTVTIKQQQQHPQLLLLSPLEFRVVVAGGGRVGRAIVERLLLAPDLIHPSRITIITRQPETVAQFAGRGVQCTGRRDGRQALKQCHVLIIACQQSQFYDFASIYCSRPHHTTILTGGNENVNKEEQLDETPRKKRHRPRQKKRTLLDVVDKWRTIDEEEEEEKEENNRNENNEQKRKNRGVYGPGGSLGPGTTKLLKPSTLVFSCCAALGTHKIAKELGHLDPLVVRADVDLTAVHSAAGQFCSAKDAFRSEFVKHIALESNSFLNKLNVLQEAYMNGETLPFELDTGASDEVSSGAGMNDAFFRVNHSRHRRVIPPPNIQTTIRSESVSESTIFLTQVWRALRCLTVIRVAALTPAEHRLFTHLQYIGPLLGAILVALPESIQQGVVANITELLHRLNNNEDDDDDDDEEPKQQQEEEGGSGVNFNGKKNDRKQKMERILIKIDQRVVPACDSDSDSEYESMPPPMRELNKLVVCFPKVIESEADALQLIRDYYNVITDRWGH